MIYVKLLNYLFSFLHLLEYFKAIRHSLKTNRKSSRESEKIIQKLFHTLENKGSSIF